MACLESYTNTLAFHSLGLGFALAYRSKGGNIVELVGVLETMECLSIEDATYHIMPQDEGQRSANVHDKSL